MRLDGSMEERASSHACSWLLVLPLPADGMHMTGSSLHESDWGAVMRDLTANGWQPSESETGEWIFDGKTAEGRDVIGLLGVDPIRE